MEQHERQQDMTTTERPQGMIPADWVPGPRQGNWTYEDYAKLDDGQRYEIINGVLLMAPAPTPWHQDVAGLIYYYLVTHVQMPKHGRVLPGPVDVYLNARDVVQPDVLVLLNKNVAKVGEKKIHGAPDLAVEVASPSTAKYDRTAKRDLYACYGVPEYWMVDPQKRTVEVLTLENGSYRSLGTFRGKDTLPSRIVPDLPVHVEQFFPEW